MPDLYSIGAEDTAVGLFGPQNVLDDMNTIKVQADELDKLIRLNVTRQALRDAWDAWFKEWTAFYEGHSSKYNPLDWISRSLNETHDKVMEYKTRIGKWREAYHAETGQKPIIPEAKGPEPFPWKTIVWIGGGAAILWAVASVTRDVTRTVREFKRGEA